MNFLNKNQYKIDYSLYNDEIFLLKRRKDVARQIRLVLTDALNKKKFNTLRLLEIGTSSGFISNYFSNYFKSVIGIDIDKNASLKWKKYKKNNISFYLMDAQNIKFKKNYFDVIITNQDYECLEDQKKFFSEIYRVLKPGGKCFLGARNKFTIIEGQYRIPFLSLLPKSIARIYLKLLGKKNIFIANYRNYWELKKLCEQFIIHDYTIKIIKDPKKFGYKQLQKIEPFTRFIPESILNMFEFLIPNFIFVLQKPND